MMVNSIPVYIICLIIYLIAGLVIPTEAAVDIQLQLDALQSTFYISDGCCLYPFITIVLVIKKVPLYHLASICHCRRHGSCYISTANMRYDRRRTLWSGCHHDCRTCGNRYGGYYIEQPDDHQRHGRNDEYGLAYIVCYCLCWHHDCLWHDSCNNTISAQTYEEHVFNHSCYLGTGFFQHDTGRSIYGHIMPGSMFSETYKKKVMPPELLSRTIEESATVTCACSMEHVLLHNLPYKCSYFDIPPLLLFNLILSVFLVCSCSRI